MHLIFLQISEKNEKYAFSIETLIEEICDPCPPLAENSKNGFPRMLIEDMHFILVLNNILIYG
jgi:hypothetical protein